MTISRPKGVRIVDAQTNEMMDYFARVIFLNASCLASNQILLNSTSSRFQMASLIDNGLLGKYIAFHNYRGVAADIDGLRTSIILCQYK
ncbi:MAG: hypothetical protein R2822_20545 [Spirosomataceae bacterium]